METLPADPYVCRVNVYDDTNTEKIAAWYSDNTEALNNFCENSNTKHHRGVDAFVNEYNSLPKNSNRIII